LQQGKKKKKGTARKNQTYITTDLAQSEQAADDGRVSQALRGANKRKEKMPKPE
jgi:hypothetical protein